MSARISLKIATLATLLALGTACGDKNSSSSANVRKPQQNAVCEGIDCLNSITWKLVLQGNVFPEKTRVEINDNTVLDECHSKQQYSIDRASAPQSLTLENYVVPRRGHVKIHIVDQGHDCTSEHTFYSKKDVDFEVVKSALGQQVLINL